MKIFMVSQVVESSIISMLDIMEDLIPFVWML